MNTQPLEAICCTQMLPAKIPEAIEGVLSDQPRHRYTCLPQVQWGSTAVRQAQVAAVLTC